MHGQLGETKRHIICWPVSTARKTMGLPYLRHLEIDSFVDSQNFPTSLSLPKRKKISSTVEYRGPSVIISGVRASFVSYICAAETWKGIKANVFQSFHWHEPASAGNKLRPAATAGEEKKNSLKIEKKRKKRTKWTNAPKGLCRCQLCSKELMCGFVCTHMKKRRSRRRRKKPLAPFAPQWASSAAFPVGTLRKTVRKQNRFQLSEISSLSRSCS